MGVEALGVLVGVAIGEFVVVFAAVFNNVVWVDEFVLGALWFVAGECDDEYDDANMVGALMACVLLRGLSIEGLYRNC